MSVSAFFNGGLQTPDPVFLTTDALTDCVEAKDNNEIIAAWTLANGTGTATLVKCYFNDGTTDFLIWAGTVAGNESVIVSDNPLNLRAGHKFKVRADQANAITVNPTVFADRNVKGHQ